MTAAIYRNECAVMRLAIRVTNQVTQPTKSSPLFISPDTERVQAGSKACALPSLLFEPLTPSSVHTVCVVCLHCEGIDIGKSGDMRTRPTGQIWHKIKRLWNV